MFLRGEDTHSDIKQKILRLETNFNVDQWVINGIHIWPYIRIKLYFLLLNNSVVEGEIDFIKKSSIKNKGFSVFKKLQIFPDIVLSFFRTELFFFRLKQRKIVFFGSHIHRVKHKEYYFNRFFDSMVDFHTLQNDVYMVEHQKVYDVNFNQEAIVPLTKMLTSYKLVHKIKNQFKKKTNTRSMEGYEDFLMYLKKEVPNAISLRINQDNIVEWTNKILILECFFKRMFVKIRPDKVIFPGYYAWDNLYAAVLTANNLGIKTIDFQHGPQTNVHMVFTSWNKIPNEGYGIMPIEYWTWDEKTKLNIDSWANSINKISSKNVGQPYLGYWQNKNKVKNYDEKIILYSLQLMPISEMLNEAIIRLIKISKRHWGIRLHPRNEFDKKDIEHFLLLAGVDQSCYSIHDSKDLPLPEILDKTYLHITAFSGCLIEAKMMGVPSIIINNIGKEIYMNYIDNDLVFYLNQKDSSFNEKFIELSKNFEKKNTAIIQRNIVNPILE